MIKIESTEISGWYAAIRGMRNPHNSWAKSDSRGCWDGACKGCPFESKDDPEECAKHMFHEDFIIGPNDHDLMMRLVSAGTDHSKFMRMITVTADVTAPLYWWKEADTYKVGTVANSCSTMHKIHAREFTYDDFSHEHLLSMANNDPMDALFLNGTRWDSDDVLGTTIKVLNYYRDRFLATKDKIYWRQMIQLLPSSYNQRRTIQLNYAVLRNIYHARKDHKLDEWREFCKWIETLPYSELITFSRSAEASE